MGVLSLTGCFSITAQPDAMIPTFVPQHQHPDAVSIAVSLKAPDWVVTSEALQESITRAIQHSGLFASVASGSGGRVHLDVNAELRRGVHQGVSILVSGIWRLTDVSTGKELFNRLIEVSHSAPTTVRNQQTYEDAVKKFIGRGLESLGRAEF